MAPPAFQQMWIDLRDYIGLKLDIDIVLALHACNNSWFSFFEE